MKPAPSGISALYLLKRPDGSTYTTSRTVIAFDDDGEPLVAGVKSCPCPQLRHQLRAVRLGRRLHRPDPRRRRRIE